MKGETLVRASFWLLTATNVVVAAALPVIPGHDLPQHLAYARILADRDTPTVRSLYEIDTSDGYATVHRALALVASHASLDVALRVLYCGYALLVPLAFAWLVVSIRGRSGGVVTVLGTALVWNPITCMGFVPFMVCLPPFLFGVGCAVRFGRRGSWRSGAGLLVASALLAAIHVVALAFLCTFVALLAIAARGRRSLVALGITAAACAAIVARHDPSMRLHAAGFPHFGFMWTSLGEKANMLLATVFGPFPHRVRLGVEVCALAVMAVVALHRSRSVVEQSHPRAFVRALALFALLSLCVPHSVREPDDLSYIDFRLFVLVFAVGLAATPPRWFALATPRLAMCAALALYTACWTTRLVAASRELEDGVALVQRLDSSDRLLALSFHDRSASFDESNGMNHYVGVYHTALTSGVTSLFWGKFARHLPVGFRAGAELPHPADWRPSDFTEAQVQQASHVLVAWPDGADSLRQRRGARRLHDLANLYELACRGRYCLYSVQSGPIAWPAPAAESAGSPSMQRTVGAMSAR